MKSEVGRLLVKKSCGRITLGKFSGRWENNIKLIITKLDERYWLESYRSGLGQVAGSCEYGNIVCFPQDDWETLAPEEGLYSMELVNSVLRQ
jgi:hypothetical protein